MKDANRGIHISEGYLPTIDKKTKEANDYIRQRMRTSRQKCIWNNKTMATNNGGLQYFKGKYNEISHGYIVQII